MKAAGYVGRFAPSPTGTASHGQSCWLLWRRGAMRGMLGGVWRVRMEDLDPPREVPGAASDILRTLEGFGLHWDGPVVYQSQRHASYAEALNFLKQNNRAYGCACTRKTLQGHAVYPGHCRKGLESEQSVRSHRFDWGQQKGDWTDAVQGECTWDSTEIGDFVIKRADGLWAYQLAVVVDDLEQGVNVVVRGSDLLDSTPKTAGVARGFRPLGRQYSMGPFAAAGQCGRAEVEQANLGFSCRGSESAWVVARGLKDAGANFPWEIRTSGFGGCWGCGRPVALGQPKLALKPGAIRTPSMAGLRTRLAFPGEWPLG